MLLGELPSGEKWRNIELKALGLRDFARVPIDQPLNPFDLASFANLIVIRFDEVAGLSETSREHLLGSGSEKWSGGACTLPNGMKLVILTRLTAARDKCDADGRDLSCVPGPSADRLSVVTKDERGKVMNRDYRKADEEEAYGVGAAALVPYGALKRMLLQGKTSKEIALHFRVIPELVEYRMKVTHLWREYKDLSRKGAK